MTKKIPPDFYAPTAQQKAELKAHAAGMRGRIRAMRNLRDTVSGFNRLEVGDQQATRKAAAVADDFRALGWSDSAAGELAAIHLNGG